jgi:site-specific DNA-methyltransferase (cytosine-N4-specific)
MDTPKKYSVLVPKAKEKDPGLALMTDTKNDFRGKVFIGDSRSMNAIPDESVALIITSPPYFSIKDYSKDGYQDKSHSTRSRGQLGDIGQFDDFVQALLDVWRECERVLIPNGKLIINTPLVPMLKKDMSTHQSRDIFDLNSSIQQSIIAGLSRIYLLDTYIWNRTNPTKKLMFGSYPYPTNFYAQNTIEFVTVYVKDGPSRKIAQEIKDQSKLSQEEWVEYTKQVWNIPIPNKSDIAFGKHTALMPEEIVKRCIRLYSFSGDTVLDPFTGSGTTLKVAKDLGRDFVGYELVPEYSKIINQKLEMDVCVKATSNIQRPFLEQNLVPRNLVNTLCHQDALSFLTKVPTGSIPLACIDPPYNMSKGEWDTWPTHGEFFSFTKDWLNEVFRVLSPGGGLFVFNTPKNCAHILQHAELHGMNFQNWITWDKRDGFAATKKKFVPAQESILYLTKPGAEPQFYADAVRVPYDSTERIAAAAKTGILKNGKRWFPNANGKLCTDVWHITSERHKNKVQGKTTKSAHPTQKPIELIERMILAASSPGDIILDCFMGTGTTALAALQNGRNFIGCESDKLFCDIAQQRLDIFLK